jgi:hypothetical protein
LSLTAGTRLGRYEVVARIGAAGWATSARRPARGSVARSRSKCRANSRSSCSRFQPRRRYQLPKADGNHHPIWSSDGRELFYVPGQGQFDAVSVSTQPRFTFGNPVSLSSALGVLDQGGGGQRRAFDMMPDGSGFLTFAPRATGEHANACRAVHIVQIWTEELKRLVPVK